MPLTAEELAEFARSVGHAVLQIQELEGTLAVHLVLVHKADARAARRDVETMSQVTGRWSETFVCVIIRFGS